MFSISNVIVIVTVLMVGGIVLFYKPLTNTSWWRAIITPLASIMGSGFLVCAPLLYTHIGNYAVWGMGILLLLAFGVGSIIRFNIQYGEDIFERKSSPVPDDSDHPLHAAHSDTSGPVLWSNAVNTIEKTSHAILILAYCISVSYYLQLLAGFALNNILDGHQWVNKALVTLILAGIGIIGFVRGLKGIERIERVVVGVNLAMIAALLAGLVHFNIAAMMTHSWQLIHLPISDSPLHLTRVIMGLLIVVQGFEISRFLSSEHSKEERIWTMRWAQIISTSIYIAFLGLMALVMSRNDLNGSEGITAIVTLSGSVAPVLPVLLILAAIGSQFSAATADDAGCAGLLEGMLDKIISKRLNYLIVSAAAITLTWLTNVYEIISYASRAFALFYAMQSVVALLIIRTSDDIPTSRTRTCLFIMLGLFCLSVTLFGLPAE